MRTTISIAEELLAEAQRLTGKTGYSDAIVSSLRDYVALRKRLALLDRLYQRPLPHSRAAIKRARRERRWSS
jgi:Arc/MetJ family transcription regulator